MKNNYIYPNIIAEMARHGDNLKTLSKKLDMNYQTLSSRLRGNKNFELPEIHRLISEYGCNFEILFAKNSDTRPPDKSV